MEPELVSEEREHVEKEKSDCCWGTWEELLLAYAVNRYGKNNWELIAIEIQTKSSSPSLVPILTPENCQQRYHHLNEKYNHNLNNNNLGLKQDQTKTNDGGDVTGDVFTGEVVPWVEELRKLRVAELRREVQRCDDSILSLQSQVKRLEDDGSKPDLEESEGTEKENFLTPGTSPASTPGETGVVVPVVRDDESIWDLEKVPGPATEGAAVLTVEKPVGEGSCDGSTETIPKGLVAGETVAIEDVKSPEKKVAGKVEPVPEFESIAESKGGSGEGGGTKENSDVQSSASLTRRKRRKTRRVSGISSEEEEPENEHVPPACRKLPVTCQPLIDVLDIIKSNQYGSIFERRLQSQKSVKYKFVIKCHIDLGLIESRLRKGRYSGNNGMHYFFRDLLLVSTNAITFFPPKSSEYHAATKMRGVILEELPKRSGRPSRSSKSESGSDLKLPLPIKNTPKLEPEPISEARLINPKSAIPFIACRKRSSVSTKARSERKDQKKAAIATLMETEVKPQLKPTHTPPPPSPPAEIEDNVPLIVSKKKGDKLPSGARSSRGGNKKNSSSNASKNKTIPSSNASIKRVGGDNDNSGPKNTKLEKGKEKEKEKIDDDDLLASSTSIAKRQSVANFLNKMKKISSSSSNKEKLSDTPKNTSGNNNSSNKKGNGRGGASGGDGKRERQISSKKQDQTSPAKRSVGRPPKRVPPPPSLSKRSRDAVETESPASKQPRKRAKK